MTHACWNMTPSEFEALEAWIEANHSWLWCNWSEQNALGDSRGYEEDYDDQEKWIEYCTPFYLKR